MIQMEKFKIIAVTNRNLCNMPLDKHIKNLFHKLAKSKDRDETTTLPPLPDMLILREKDLPDSDYKKLAVEIISICNEYGVEAILHSHINIVRDLQYRKIHLPFSELLALHANTSFADTFSMPALIGTSIHSAEDLKQAVELKANYAFAGHIFATDSKKGLAPKGMGFLKEILLSKPAEFPIYAIGGIKPENLEIIRRAGAGGACMMSEYMLIPLES